MLAQLGHDLSQTGRLCLFSPKECLERFRSSGFGGSPPRLAATAFSRWRSWRGSRADRKAVSVLMSTI
jgi:hypothetical protein